MPQVILQVEDDENDVFLFSYAMSKIGPGCAIRAVSDGQMAIDYLRGYGKFRDRETFPIPCLILLDLKLPEVPGLEVLNWIRTEARLTVPIIILSSSDDRGDISAAYRLGADAYLVKPPNLGRLLEIAKLINDYCLEQDPARPLPSMALERPRTNIGGTPVPPPIPDSFHLTA